ncbi:hypothetical protein [Vibrio phage LV6]|nr:hypothetical protein [Vibrio phage LV6]
MVARPRKNPPKPKMVTITCACGCNRTREVREADVKRGWGKYYDKSCKAKAQAKEREARHNGKGRRTRRSGGIANAPAPVRARTLINALNEDRISTEFFAMMYPDSQRHLLSDELVDIIDNEMIGHPMESGIFGHGQE